MYAVKERTTSSVYEEESVEHLATLLKSCCSSKSLAMGKWVHSQVLESESRYQNVYLNTLLIKMYGRCGCIEDAARVFDWMKHRNVFTWNNMIAAYAHKGHLVEARCLFEKMPERDVESWSVIVVGYARSSQIHIARYLFERMPERNLMASNAMLAAFAQNGLLEEAERLLGSMVERDIFTWNTMISAYCQHDLIDRARELFERMLERDVVSWTTLVSAYAQKGHIQEAQLMFERMPRHDIVVWNAMIAGYSQSGMVTEAWSLFQKMPEQDVASWNSIICACTQHGQGEKAVELYEKMNVPPNRITFISILEACASISALKAGRRVHQGVARTNSTTPDVDNALITMYAKCGSLTDSELVFSRMPEKNMVSWTAMICAHSQCGEDFPAIDCFHNMLSDGHAPNDVTFIALLAACSHDGLLNRATELFTSMQSDFRVPASDFHYVCMEDLLTRVGKLDDAEELISCMPFEPDEMAWLTLLGALVVYGESPRAVEILLGF